MVSKSKNAPRLVVIEGKEKGRHFPLKSGTTVIGRSKGDVLVQDPRLSRSHVAVHYDEITGKVTFTDLKSLNGTLLKP
jgi:S-DNA-T family DNA segregation ATPase FtsK/SpoIIIE